MRKAMLVFAALCASVSVAFAAAPDRVGHFDIGLNAGGAFNDKVEDVGFYSATVSYGFLPWFAVGVEGGWQEGEAASDEEVGSVPIMADLIFRVPNVHESLVPYGVIGLGAIGTYVEDDNGIAPTNNGDDVDDTTFGWKIGGGVDWFLNPNWVINAEVAYYDSDPDLPRASVDGTASWVSLTAGLKFVF